MIGERADTAYLVFMEDIQITFKIANSTGYWTHTIKREVFNEIIEHSLSLDAIILRQALIGHYFIGGSKQVADLSPNEQKFYDFFVQAYNKAIDVNQMSYEELDAWITKLEDTMLTAKAALQGSTQARRERKAKLSKDERDKTPEGYTLVDASDSMAGVKKRADRISKVDKIRASLKALGLDDKEINEKMGVVSVNEDAQPAKNNLYTFTKASPEEKPIFNGTPKAIDTCSDCNLDYEHGTKHQCSKPKAATAPDMSYLDNLFK